MRIEIKFEIDMPDDIDYTEKELEDYLRFEYRDNGSLKTDNPFYQKGDTEPIFGTFEWEIL